MSAIYLILAIFGVFFQSIVQKQYNKRVSNQGAYIFNAIACISGAFVFAVTNTDGFDFDLAVLPYSFGFGIGLALAILFIFLAIRDGSMSLTCLLKAYSILAPTFFGIFFLNELVGWTFWIGLVFLVISIFLINMKKEDAVLSKRWWLYIVILFISNGSASTVQLLQQKKFHGQYRSEFMLIAFLISAVIFIVLSILNERKEVLTYVKKAGFYMVAMGLLLGGANLFLLLTLASGLPSPIVYPVMSGGGIILATVASVLVYKEKLSWMQVIGLICGVISVVFMNL